MESGDDTVLDQRWPHAVLIAASHDPYTLIDAAVARAATISGDAKPLSQKTLPPSLDVFGWCSWDAFYSSVSAQGLTSAVESLKAGGVPPRLVIIDDGWQVTDLDAQFKGWQDPGARFLPKGALPSAGGSEPSGGDERAREVYIEGESEMISAVLRDIPAGSATGVLLQEVKAADDEAQESVDYQTMAQQHDAAGCSPSGGGTGTMSRTGRSQRDGGVRLGRRRHRYMVVRLTGTVLQYATGLLVGAVQALILLFYQWIVDPAADGTWPVKFFAYLASGPLRDSMLQFYADQTNFTRRLTDVRANSKFHAPDANSESVHSGRPENLASVVNHLRNQLSVKYIYCWHGLSAYWSGVCPSSPAMQRYNPRLVYAKPPLGLREIEPSMLWNPSVLAGLGAVHDPRQLFRDMHEYLASAGVTGVKVDCQAGVGIVGSVTGGGPAVAARYHGALEDSVAAYFPSNQAINCMCHSTENIYRWRDTAVARGSDDFYPTDAASHLPHIAACAFNGLFLSALALPDWDMFQSKHIAAEVHAAARAVSGGPVYVSDAPGCHAFDILRQLVLPDGSVLRARLPGRPTRDSLFYDVMRDGQSLLKVWNVNDFTGVVGVFHLQGSSWDRNRRRFAFHSKTPPPLTTTVKVADVEPLRSVAAAACGDEASFADTFMTRDQDGGDGDRYSSSEASSESEDAHWNAPPPSTSSSMSNGNRNRRTAGKNTAYGSYARGYDSDISSEGDADGHLRRGPQFGRRAVQPQPCCDYVVYVNKTKTLSRIGADGGVDVSLEAGQAAVVTLAPVSTAFGVDFSPIGLVNMLNSGGALVSVEVEPDRVDEGSASVLSESSSETDTYSDLLSGQLTTELTGGGTAIEGAAWQSPLPRFIVGVRGRGSLVAYCSARPQGCRVEGYEVPWRWKEGKLEVDVPQVGNHEHQRLVIQFRG